MGLIKEIRIGSDADRQLGAVAIPFGKLDSTSTETVMTATVNNFPTTLSDGVCAYVVNGVVTSASGFTLDINGTGALPVYQTQAAASRASTVFNINHTYLFVYNSSRVEGGCWDIYYGYSNSLAYQIRTNSMRKALTDKCYRYRILFSSADDTKYVPANTSTSTNATASRTVCQTKINPWGDIRYYSSTTALSAGDKPAATSLHEQYAVTLGYSFNRTGAALTLTSWAPVYVKCAPQTDGSAIMDSTTPYVQALPSTADDKIYIFLGVAASATSVELLPYHPVYYYKDGAIRIWTNAAASGNIPDAATATPLMDGTGAVGTATKYAREDHVHPSDTSKADAATTLSGYGITDAKIESGTITLGSNTITPLTSHQDISGKADKVSNATSGNFAALDSNGNLTDSGHKHSDYLTSHQDISGKQDVMAETTWSDLKALRDGGTLQPGKKYRITDYVAKTSDTESQSANHAFDIIVTALTASKLSEEAGAMLHSGDTYFASTNFNAWRVWYCLDNDSTRFTWADTSNGKGVVYRLIDEWDNDLPYDFKGIQFKRYKVTPKSDYSTLLSSLGGLYIGTSTSMIGLDSDSSDSHWYFTFNRLDSDLVTPLDASLSANYCATNTFESTGFQTARTLNNVVVMGGTSVYNYLKTQYADTNTGDNYLATNNHFGENVNNITVFGNMFNVYSESQFRRNIIVCNFRHQTLLSDVEDNLFYCQYESSFNFIEGAFNNNLIACRSFCQGHVSGYFMNNTVNNLVKDFYGNRFNLYCRSNTFSSRLYGNTFNGRQIQYNTFLTDCISNTFDSIVEYVTIPSASGNFAYNTIQNIRGSSSVPISLDNSNFFLSSLAGVKRHITITGDINGKIVATWKDNGIDKGVYKATTDVSWTAFVSGDESTSNKVTSISSSSTDTQYPSAKCVYDAIQAGGGGMNASVSGRVLTITGVTVNNRNLIL